MSKKASKDRRRSKSNSLDITLNPACLQIIEDFITNNAIAVFSKSWCDWCTKAKEAIEERGLKYKVMELDLEPDGANLQKALKHISGLKTVPNIYINNRHIGGFSELRPLIECGLFEDVCAGTLKECEYDLIVIGGGSGGISAAKEAAQLGKKVALCDFVVPTPLGNKWGLGGTCVNVGCIPKKLMHRAAVIRQDMAEGKAFGWHSKSHHDFTHDWNHMVDAIQNYIKSLNFGYRKTLLENNIKYFNHFASFVDKNTLKLKSHSEEMQVTSKNFVIATGGRPKYPNIKNAKEFCLTSDDLFNLNVKPGRTLVIGGSYVALECAGFLVGLGYDVTVMVRSILLRGFDQQMAGLIEDQMTKIGVKFVRDTVPTCFEKEQKHGTYTVHGSQGSAKWSGVFDTVILAIGRDPCTDKLNLSSIGVKVDANTQKILTDEKERTSVPNIFAVGDVAHGRPELTPPAIQAGKLLAQRMYGQKTKLMDYKNVATTVFTPCEYGCVGYSEEDAIKDFGQDQIEVYHQSFTLLEHSLNEADHAKCYGKLIVRKDNGAIIGAHIFSPNAGEVIQGYALALKMGAKKSHFDDLVGIHPTIAEIFTTLDITKSSGKPSGAAGC